LLFRITIAGRKKLTLPIGDYAQLRTIGYIDDILLKDNSKVPRTGDDIAFPLLGEFVAELTYGHALAGSAVPFVSLTFEIPVIDTREIETYKAPIRAELHRVKKRLLP